MCLKKDCYWGHYLKLSPPVLHLSKTSEKTLPCYHCPPEKEKPRTLPSTKAAHLFRNHLVTLWPSCCNLREPHWVHSSYLKFYLIIPSFVLNSTIPAFLELAYQFSFLFAGFPVKYVLYVRHTLLPAQPFFSHSLALSFVSLDSLISTLVSYICSWFYLCNIKSRNYKRKKTLCFSEIDLIHLS